MNKILKCALILAVSCGAALSVFGQTPEPGLSAAPAATADAGGKRAREFQGDELGQVLRLLARQAKISLMVDEAIKGTVNLRFENASAMDAIEAIARQYKLTLSKDEKGIYYLSPPDLADATLDLLAKPETAARVAAFKRNLYEALMKEGFTSEEAVQVMGESDLGATAALLGKKPDASASK